MTTDLKYLAWTAMLTAVLWIPYVVCQVMTNGFLAPPNYVDPAPRPVASRWDGLRCVASHTHPHRRPIGHVLDSLLAMAETAPKPTHA